MTPEGHAPSHDLLTPRLALRLLDPADAPALHALGSDAAFMRQCGDRLRDRAYVEVYIPWSRTLATKRAQGIFSIRLRDTGDWIGICALAWRAELGREDLGFALLDPHRGQGLAFEAARHLLDLHWAHGGERIAAVALPDNAASMAILRKLGFHRQGWAEAAGRRHAFFHQDRPVEVPAAAQPPTCA